MPKSTIERLERLEAQLEALLARIHQPSAGSSVQGACAVPIKYDHLAHYVVEHLGGWTR